MTQQTNRLGSKVMLIGFDGATLDLIKPWAESGLLPTFDKLIKQGAWGPLQSAMPPVTPAAWSTLATGMNQGKHGLYDFYGRKPKSYDSYLVNSTHRHGATLWHLLSQADQRVTVFNVPATYPPDPVNGLMVSGLLTPTLATDASQPPELLAELRSAVPDFSFYPPGIFSRGEEAKFVDDVLNWDRMTLRATRFLMEKEPWDFLFTVFIGVDIISHMMWRHMATNGASVPGDDAELRETCTRAIQSVYQQADAILAELLEQVDEDTYVMLVSDHGFGPLDYYVHLNTWLAEKGYLKFKRTPFVQLKYLAHRLGITPLAVLEWMRALRLGGKVQDAAGEHKDGLKALVKQAFISMQDVDWSRTTAYSTGYGGPIFVNLKGREPQGIVEPGKDYTALLTRLEADLRAVRHPVTGEPFVGEIYPPEQLYSGPFLAQAPDLTLVPRDWRNQGYGVHDFASRRWLEPSPDRSGTHRMNGILLVSGPGVQPGYIGEGPALWDVAPTVLALMGVPIPTEMDGHLMPVLSGDLKSQLAIRFSDAISVPSAPEMATVELSAEDERIMRERLEALGYLD